MWSSLHFAIALIILVLPQPGVPYNKSPKCQGISKLSYHSLFCRKKLYLSKNSSFLSKKILLNDLFDWNIVSEKQQNPSSLVESY